MNYTESAPSVIKALEARQHFSAGTIDTTFGDDGVFPMPYSPFDTISAIQRDGKILTASASQLHRRRPGGGVDRTFSKNGTVSSPVGTEAVALQRDGKILVTGAIVDNDDFEDGYHLGVARFTKSGRPDKTFGKGGIYEYNSYSGSKGMAIGLRAGKIVVAGHVNLSSAMLIVLDLNGKPDLSFSKDGVLKVQEFAWPSEVWISRDGGITTLLSDQGSNGATIVARVTKTGDMDARFSEDGVLPLPDYSAADAFMHGNGSMVLAGDGHERSSLLGITRRGKIDKQFGQDGFVYLERDKRLSFGVLQGPNGAHYLTGSAGTGHLLENPRMYVAKLTSDYLFDQTFGDGGIFIVQPDVEQDSYGAEIVPGQAKIVFSTSHGTLVRVNLS